MAKKETAKIKFKLVRSLIGASKAQVKIATAMGFKKLNQVVEHSNSETIKGMANKIAHMVEIVE
ncbi:50S ribosomal protein L30 [bacterium]|nr:50S ribosomal protein L30 [bacterium]